MNLAFLVEGRTELNLYPKWIKYLSQTQLTQCLQYSDVVADQFIIFDVKGIYGMNKGIPSIINDIIANPVFDYLVIVVDADANDKLDITNFIQGIIGNASTPQLPVNCQLKIIIQQVCIETWFTGHTDYFRAAKARRDSGILKVMNEYDIENNDPELMPNCQVSIVHSIGQYHKMYLTKMIKGATNTWYKEKTAHTIIDIPYFQRLEQRLTETPTHLNSFTDMITFLKSL